MKCDIQVAIVHLISGSNYLIYDNCEMIMNYSQIVYEHDIAHLLKLKIHEMFMNLENCEQFKNFSS